MNEIIKIDKNEIECKNDDTNLIKTSHSVEIDISKDDVFDVKKYVSKVFNDLNVLDKTKQVINPELKYIVDIPINIQKKIQSGDYFIQKKKESEKLMTQVYHIVNGKKVVVKKLDMVESKLADSVAFSNMINASSQQLISQQICSLQEQMEVMKEIIDEIEKGQKDDRIGEIIGGKINLEIALKIKDKTIRDEQLNNIVQTLTIATGKMQKLIKRRIESYKKIPDKNWRIYLEMIIHKKYKTSKDKEYNDICELINYYIDTQNMLVYIYQLMGENDAIKKIYEINLKYVEAINFENIKTIKNLYPNEEKFNDIVTEPKLMLETEKDKFLLTTNNKIDNISIIIDGRQLVEVLNEKEGKR